MSKPIEIFQIDAFTDQIFRGNPAAVCPLGSWPSDNILQNIALENNLAETAFFIPLANGNYHLRWFTPEIEMDLCGHATLASAYVIFEELRHESEVIQFETKSGLIKVRRSENTFVLDFPSRPPIQADLPAIITESLNILPVEVWKSRDYLLVYRTEQDILQIIPNMAQLNLINLDPGGIIVTAPGQDEDVDFVSRFFTPGATIFEDPVTGSAHCTLIPYWGKRLDKTHLHAIQRSAREGYLQCTWKENRVEIIGQAKKYLHGHIYI